MSDAALSERRAAAVEDSGPSDPMKPAAGKTGRGGRAEVRSSQPASMEGPDASKAWRSRRADMGSSDRAPGMESPDASEARRNGRADVGNSGAVKLVKIAAKAAAESAAGKTGGDGRRAGVETWRWMYAAYAKAMQAWSTAEGAMETSGPRSAASTQAPRGLQSGVNGVRRPGMQNGEAVAMMSPDR